MMIKNQYFLLICIILLFFTGCNQPEKIKSISNKAISKAMFKKVKWSDIKGFDKDNLDDALKVFKKDCKVSKKYKNLEDICLKSTVATDGKYFFTQYFSPYKLLSSNTDKGLITGYYEPMLQGSIKKTQRFKYPIYNVPKDLVTIDISEVYPELKKYKLRGKLIGNIVIPYDSREDIENKSNSNNEFLKPICYVDDKIDLFFLHIQGSGKVELRDGSILNIGYGEQNGRKYYAIGRKLIQMGVISKDDVSLNTIKEWLIKNPRKIDDILNLNHSYVFFIKTKKDATGSLGTELIAQRNIAVDPRYIPLGFPVFINTTNPIDDTPLNKLVIAADTGGAIKGEIRADLFFGSGIGAAELAGKMKQKGKMYIFIPKNIDINFK